MADTMMVFLTFSVGVSAGYFLRRYICRIFHIQIRKDCFWVEAGNGLLYVLVFLSEGWTVSGGVFCLSSSVLLAIGIIDQQTFEIPFIFNLLIGSLGVIHLFFDWRCWQEYLAGMFAASSLLILVYLISKGKGMGGGDIKLMAASGILLGLDKSILALFIGAVSGAVIHLLCMRLYRKGRRLAFGPYLAFGIFTAMLYGDDILDWYLLNFG